MRLNPRVPMYKAVLSGKPSLGSLRNKLTATQTLSPEVLLAEFEFNRSLIWLTTPLPKTLFLSHVSCFHLINKPIIGCFSSLIYSASAAIIWPLSLRILSS